MLDDMGTLFAHLVTRFTTHPENLATEALVFMLAARSPTARAAFRGVLVALEVSVPEELRWQSQVTGDDDARPDLVGLNATGAPAVIIEAKFWAGLTDKQPIAYMERLPPGGVLCVVGPAKRHSLLVAELRHRIVGNGWSFNEEKTGQESTVVAVGERKLVVLSWRSILTAIIERAEQAGERTLAEDARQLDGLCEEQDTKAFLPVSREELTAVSYYRRVEQFSQLVDELADREPEGKKGLRPVAGRGFYGRYLRLRGVGVLLLCDVRKWTRYAPTPLWLSVLGPTFQEADKAAKALAPLAQAKPCRMYMGRDGFPTVPLFVPTGVEKDIVLAKVFEQITEVGNLIAHLALGASSEQTQSSPPLDPSVEVEPS